MRTKVNFYLVLFFALLFVACENEDTVEPTTFTVTNTRFGAVDIEVNIPSSVGEVTDYGFEVTPNNGASQNISLGVLGNTGTISTQILGLLPGTSYSARLYTTTASGTTYGETVSFTTKTPTASDFTISPEQGQRQTTITIKGDFTGMENLLGDNENGIILLFEFQDLISGLGSGPDLKSKLRTESIVFNNDSLVVVPEDEVFFFTSAPEAYNTDVRLVTEFDSSGGIVKGFTIGKFWFRPHPGFFHVLSANSQIKVGETLNIFTDNTNLSTTFKANGIDLVRNSTFPAQGGLLHQFVIPDNFLPITYKVTATNSEGTTLEVTANESDTFEVIQ